MFGFPTDLFGLNGNPTVSVHPQNLFGNALMISSSSTFGGGMLPNVTSNSIGPMQSFTSTTVMSYSGTDGRPKIYQETTATNRGPGGVEETRQAIRDSERGINKVQIGHRIGDRKHVIEREMNVRTGQISENVELENLDEDETDDFKKEWRQRSTHLNHYHHQQQQQQQPSYYQPHFNRLHHQQSLRPQLAIEHHSSKKPSQFQHSDTIDLTEDNSADDDIEEIQQIPPPSSSTKRKLSKDDHTQRKHR